MKRMRIIIATAVICLAVAACEEKEGQNESLVSSKNSSESHRMGENCMNCHKSGGSGEGWFKLAGTVYNEAKTNTFANSIVKLYTQPNGEGTLKYTINGDAKGNFYTTENIDFGNGLYVSVEGTTASFMVTPVSSGQCNSCHGSSTAKIWTK